MSSPTDGVIFVGVSLLIGVACRHLLARTKLPYTLALLTIGIALGSLEYGAGRRLGKFGNGIRIWADIDPDLLLAVFLPALLFESTFTMEFHQIKRCMVQMFLVAGPGVLMSALCLGCAIKATFPFKWSWNTCLLLGSLLSATDPVAVVAHLKELGASKKLSTIIEGESMMNDGYTSYSILESGELVAVVIYQLFLQLVLGRSFNWGSMIKYLVEVSLGAVAIGVAFGIVSLLWLRFVFSDTITEITLTLAVSYVSYFSAQEWANVSGILAVMTLGMFYSAFARTAFKGESQESLHNFWGMVAHIANTLVFILSGVLIAEGVLRSDTIIQHKEYPWGYLLLLYIFVQVVRFMVVGVLFPSLQYFGYGMDWKEAIILVWSGLRGAVSLSLSLSVKARLRESVGPSLLLSTMCSPLIARRNCPTSCYTDCLSKMQTSKDSSHISPNTGTMFLFFTSGIVVLTLIINGSTTQFLLNVLKMDQLSPAKLRNMIYELPKCLRERYTFSYWRTLPKRRVLNFTKYEMLNKAFVAFGNLRDDEELGPADWSSVKTHIASLNDLEHESVHPLNSAVDHNELSDIRVRFFNGVQAAYLGMLNEGRIAQDTALYLMQSVDEGIDLVSNSPLCDWENLRSHVVCPSRFTFRQTSVALQKLIRFVTTERLEFACCVCAAFLRAHRIARLQLYDFIGESNTASMVIKESEEEGEEARKFLDDVRVTFPQVLRVLKTRQTTYAVLIHLIDYAHNLEKVGLLEKKEMIHLHDAVQTDLKKLLRNPPAVKVPRARDLFCSHPLARALPSSVHETIIGSIKEIIELRGATLYVEGTRPTGIWLISSGVVKRSGRNKHSLHPTFSHGNTLGLYEVLGGLPYLCDTITDSLVHCFFIESRNIFNVCNSDPTVEEFLWQESTIVLSKLLHPLVFDKMAMQDLRSLVTEWSTMSIYQREETFDLSHSIGFLLEGSVKRVGSHDEWFNCPAALLPCDGDPTFELSETSGAASQVVSYRAETMARVMLLNLAEYEANKITTRQGNLADHPFGSLNKEHHGLMSWPGNLGKQHHHRSCSEGAVGLQKTELSPRSMRLSIFGGTVNSEQLPPNNISLHTTSSLSRSRSLPGTTPIYAQHIVSSSMRSGSSSSPVMQKKFTDVRQEASTLDHLISVPQADEEDDSCRRWSGEKAEPTGDKEEEHHIVITGFDSSSTPSFLQPLLKK